MALSKCNLIVTLLVAISFVSGCGGGSGGGEKDKPQSITIKYASRCVVDPIHIFPDLGPSTCMTEAIEGNSYTTDQGSIHLYGIASKAVDDGCPKPSSDYGICIPHAPRNYIVSWTNSRNQANGKGKVAFFFIGSEESPVKWNTYGSNAYDAKAIPLGMGSNDIHINTSNSGYEGNTTFRITRVVDVIPPKVQNVDPKPGGTYGFRIVVNFNEQLDPASLVGAINVFDQDASPIPGTSEFNAGTLEAIWQPESALKPAYSYTARISGVTDQAPNTMIEPYVWSFTTSP